MASLNQDKFKVGDRVVFMEEQGRWPFNPPKGTPGTVVKCDGDGAPCIKWEKPTKDGSLFSYVRQTSLEKYVEPKKVVIWQDPHDRLRVVAKDTLTGETGEARCHPEEQDSFNFELGAHIALGRLYGHEPVIAEVEVGKPKPKPYNAKVVCIQTDYRWWTVGRIYEVNDGIILDDDGDDRRQVFSLAELHNVVLGVDGKKASFIEIKE